MRKNVNEESAVQSILRGDKQAKYQLLEDINNGDAELCASLQKRLANAIVDDSSISDDAEDVLSACYHRPFFLKQICPDASAIMIKALKNENIRAKIFFLEYMKDHYLDDDTLLCLIGSLASDYPLVGEVLKSYLEDEHYTEKCTHYGHLLDRESKQRLITLVRKGNPEARRLYICYANARGKDRAFCQEEVQCVDFMSEGFSEFKEVLIGNHSSLKGKLRLMELLRRGSTDAYDVLHAHGIVAFGDETELRAIELLAEGCKGAKELLLQYAAKRHFSEANLKKLQRLAARGSEEAEEILRVHQDLKTAC